MFSFFDFMDLNILFFGNFTNQNLLQGRKLIITHRYMHFIPDKLTVYIQIQTDVLL